MNSLLPLQVDEIELQCVRYKQNVHITSFPVHSTEFHVTYLGFVVIFAGKNVVMRLGSFFPKNFRISQYLFLQMGGCGVNKIVKFNLTNSALRGVGPKLSS